MDLRHLLLLTANEKIVKFLTGGIKKDDVLEIEHVSMDIISDAFRMTCESLNIDIDFQVEYDMSIYVYFGYTDSKEQIRDCFEAVYSGQCCYFKMTAKQDISL